MKGRGEREGGVEIKGEREREGEERGRCGECL